MLHRLILDKNEFIGAEQEFRLLSLRWICKRNVKSASEVFEISLNHCRLNGDSFTYVLEGMQIMLEQCKQGMLAIEIEENELSNESLETLNLFLKEFANRIYGIRFGSENLSRVDVERILLNLAFKISYYLQMLLYHRDHNFLSFE
jgi:hypothetical protein